MTLSDAPDTDPTDSSPDSKPGRERILEHARALFLERGYVDVSMREIAEAANLRKASIYHHFADKEALFTAIVMEEVVSSRARLAESIVGLTALPERLEELAFTHFSNPGLAPARRASSFALPSASSFCTAAHRFRSSGRGTGMVGGVSLMFPSIARWVVLLKNAVSE